jgi:hemoglobin
MNIEEKPAAGTPFEWIGGEERVQALTERFYDLMDWSRVCGTACGARQ